MDKNSFDHLLVIRLSALGDVAMTVPVLVALARQYPQTRITFLTRPFFRPIFKDLDNVSVIGVDLKGKHKGIVGLGRLYSSLSKMEIDAVADLHNVLRTNILKRYFTLSKTPYVQIDKGRVAKRALTRSRNKQFEPIKTTFERYADVFRTLGFDLKLENAKPKKRLRLPLQSNPGLARSTEKWIGIAPFAAFSSKMYPLEMIEKVIAKLNSTDNCKVLLFGGGPTEETILKKLSQKYSNVLNMAGSNTFEEELAVISNLDLMVSMDSGNGHLAAMYGVPTITIWGVTHPYAGFAPFGQDPDNSLMPDRGDYPLIPTSVYGKKYPKTYENAIGSISPDLIVNKIMTVLNA